MAKIILRPEPYDPDAIDADGDGIVQERTPWERPAGARLLDKFGQAIETGRSLTDRPDGLKVVTADGRVIPYTPSYAAETGAPSASSPLSDHGVRTLREMGLPTVQSIAAPPPPIEPDAPPPMPPPHVPLKAPKPPYSVSPPPKQGSAQDLADEAGGNWEKFAELVNQRGFVAFDYETTGLPDDDPDHKPVQVGAVKIVDGKVVGRLNLYMNPERKLEGWSKDNLKNLDGEPMTDEWLQQQMSIAEAHQQLVDFMGDSILVAHNSPFDLGFLERALKDSKIDHSPAGSIDTLELARQVIPKGDGVTGPQSHGLKALTDFLGVPFDTGWHTADADSEATSKLLGGILNHAIDHEADGSVMNAAKQKEMFDKKLAQYEKDKEKFLLDKETYDRAVAKGDDLPPRDVVAVPTVKKVEAMNLDGTPIVPRPVPLWMQGDHSAAPLRDTLSPPKVDKANFNEAAGFEYAKQSGEASVLLREVSASAVNDIAEGLSEDPDLFEVWESEFSGRMLLKVHPEGDERDWDVRAEEKILQSDLSPEKKDQLLKSLGDYRAAEEANAAAGWTVQSNIPGPPKRYNADPFGDDEGVEIVAPYSQEEARTKFDDAFKKLSPERQKAIKQGLADTRLEKLRAEHENQVQSQLSKEIGENRRLGKKLGGPAREHDPGVGEALVGVRDATGADFPVGEESRSGEELQSQAAQVLVKAGDLTDPAHEAEAIQFLGSLDELVQGIIDGREIPAWERENADGREYVAPGKALVEHLIESRKFDGDALQASPEEIDALMLSGWEEAGRGGSRVPAEEFIDGEMMIGSGLAGAGLYFAKETQHPDDEQLQQSFQADGYAEIVSGGGVVIRTVVNPTANIGRTSSVAREVEEYQSMVKRGVEPSKDNDLTNLRARLEKASATSPEAKKALKNLDEIILNSDTGEDMNSIGVAAILQGLDGVADGRGNSNRLVIYNRSAVVTQNGVLSPEQYKSQKSFDNFKERVNAVRIKNGDLPLNPTPEQVTAWKDTKYAQLMEEFDAAQL